MVHIPRRTDMRVFMPFSSFPTLLLQLITNGFNILDAEMNSIATAIYLGVSITDHSCQPNAVATFEGNELHIHAIEDMECLDWSKIFISYIDLLNTPEQRRLDLKEHYYFLCVCTKCTDAKESKEMLAALCPNRTAKRPTVLSSLLSMLTILIIFRKIYFSNNFRIFCKGLHHLFLRKMSKIKIF